MSLENTNKSLLVSYIKEYLDWAKKPLCHIMKITQNNIKRKSRRLLVDI